MATQLNVEQNEVRIVIASECGAELSYDRVNDVVDVNSSVDYNTFMKMCKLLKRMKNKISFDTDFED
ncbi:hypothetical protein M3_0044 [Lysinibacillus phage vB_LfM_LysYB1]|nr:hypothetical protein M3_0044 [Lysinibacillus phage vB_LfM_LysYB1]WAB25213.1 hypothetical protein M5_0035 [Lysinibacillus phage vB_LfM_LysYB2]